MSTPENERLRADLLDAIESVIGYKPRLISELVDAVMKADADGDLQKAITIYLLRDTDWQRIAHLVRSCFAAERVPYAIEVHPPGGSA
jgi:hypothetical protein